MDRREFLQNSLAGAGSLSTLVPPPSDPEKRLVISDPQPTSRPNILFIMTDQQRYDCLGANGNRVIRTPNLDRLAAESANFSRCYVQAPVCVPSRACFFTGRYAHSHRNRVNYTCLPPDEILMQKRLQGAGYTTCLVGKTHLYYEYPPTREQAMRTGFDRVELHDGAKSTDAWSDYVQWRNTRDPKAKTYYRSLAEPEGDHNLEGPSNPYRCAIDEEYTDTSWTGIKTREHLERLAKGTQPFFLFSSFWKPHSPYEVPHPFDSLYSDIDIELPRTETAADMERLPLPVRKLALRGNNRSFNMDRKRLQWIYRSYYGTITHIDREVGLILQTLRDLDLEKDTIVVFCSDHGDQLLEHGIMGKNVFYEASERVPFMIRLSNKVHPGTRDDFIETVDVMPTLFDLIGLEEPTSCQGTSFAPLITARSQGYRPRDAVFSENIIPEIFSNSVFFEKGKGADGIRHPDAKMVRTADWKYNYYPEGFAELYDLRNDPLEQVNLATDPGYRNTGAELRDRILDWLINSVETDQIAPRWLV